MLSDWLASGRLLDIILGAVMVEALALSVWYWRTGRGLSPRLLLPNLAAGASLLLALRLALGGAPTLWLAAVLLVALLAHLTDLYARSH